MLRKEEILWRRNVDLRQQFLKQNKANRQRKTQSHQNQTSYQTCQNSNRQKSSSGTKRIIVRERSPDVLCGLEEIDFDPDFRLFTRSGKMQRLGLDIGTKNIVLAYTTDDKKKIRHEVNGFIKIPKGDGFTKQLLVNSGVAYVENENEFIALGKKAEELSYAFNKTLERPMVDGVISGKTEEAMQIMAIIIRAIIGKLEDDAVLYYCVPSDALNSKTNVAFHGKVVKMMIDDFEGGKITSFPINEARAIVIGGVEDKTAIGISFGAGMVNVCYCLYGIEVFSFSIIGSGDRIDIDSAVRFGYDPANPGGSYKETPTSICKRKEKMSLKECPEDMVGKTIWINYGIMIENVVKGIIDGFKNNEEKARIDKPIPIVIAGGTASPDGFVEYFREVVGKLNIPFDIGDISMAEKPLYSVAEGCLVASEMHEC